MGGVEKFAMRLFAFEQLSKMGMAYSPPIFEPEHVRKHVDGPYVRMLNGTMHWLTLFERFMFWLGRWDAWDIEARYCPIFAKSQPHTNEKEAE